jgi:ankyrin repeat protein
MMRWLHVCQVFALSFLAVTAGCQKNPQDEAREKLVGEMGVRWSPETFIQAAMNGDSQVVGLFLTGGMDPNVSGDEGKTALIWAATNGHAEIVKTLLDNEADPNAIDTMGKTALMWAAEEDRIFVVQALLAKGADGNIKALDGSTAMTIAQKKGNSELVKLFDQAGVQP